MLERIWSKGNTSALLVGMQTCTVALEISIAISQKIRNQSTSGLSNTTFDIYPKDAQSYHKTFAQLCSQQHYLSQLEPGNNLDAAKEWIRKRCFIYTTEYYSAVKNNDNLKFAGKWTELEKKIQSEVTQIQKDKYSIFSLISGYQA